MRSSDNFPDGTGLNFQGGEAVAMLVVLTPTIKELNGSHKQWELEEKVSIATSYVQLLEVSGILLQL
jgi:hypothetical protein